MEKDDGGGGGGGFAQSKLRWMLGPRDWLPQIHQEE